MCSPPPRLNKVRKLYLNCYEHETPLSFKGENGGGSVNTPPPPPPETPPPPQTPPVPDTPPPSTPDPGKQKVIAFLLVTVGNI